MIVLKLEEIKKDAAINCIKPNEFDRVVTIEAMGEPASTVYYGTIGGQLAVPKLFRADESILCIAGAGRFGFFDAPGAALNLSLEAYRNRPSDLFEPMLAVCAVDVGRLPQQTSAV